MAGEELARVARSAAVETTPGYTFADVGKILGVPEAKLRYWAQTGFVGPSLRKGVHPIYTFADLVVVKAAKELTDRGFDTADIRLAVQAAQASLPMTTGAALRRLRVAFDGKVLVVLDEGAAFESSGQRVFHFGLEELAEQGRAVCNGAVAVAPTLSPPPSMTDSGREVQVATTVHGRKPNAYDWFVDGLALEAQPGREEQAGHCYRQAIAADPGLAAAHTNLGMLACRRGDREAARAAFSLALTLDPEQAEARFNLANLLIEDGEIELAAAELRRVLQTAPDLADAHYNLATALEALGGRAQAREHLDAFLRLVPAGVDDPWAAEARQRIERLR